VTTAATVKEWTVVARASRHERLSFGSGPGSQSEKGTCIVLAVAWCPVWTIHLSAHLAGLLLLTTLLCMPPYQILEIKTESADIVNALNTLSGIYQDNTAAARRQLRNTLEERGLAINEQFLEAAQRVTQVYLSLYRICSCHCMCMNQSPAAPTHPPSAVQPSVIIQMTKASIQTISNTKQQQTN